MDSTTLLIIIILVCLFLVVAGTAEDAGFSIELGQNSIEGHGVAFARDRIAFARSPQRNLDDAASQSVWKIASPTTPIAGSRAGDFHASNVFRVRSAAID